MDVELRQLRCLVAIVEEGTFTDAGIALGVSQAAVSRTLASLERALGAKLLERTSRTVTPTAAGLRVAAHARRVLAEVADLVEEAASGTSRVRIGYAWSALGRHTAAVQRRWAAVHPETELQLVRVNSATAGLAEGACDLAVVRRPVDERRFDAVVVGQEQRLCALAADDALARRRSVRLADLADRVLLVDRRTGTTTLDLCRWTAIRPSRRRRTSARTGPCSSPQRPLHRRDRGVHRAPVSAAGGRLPAGQGRRTHRRAAGVAARGTASERAGRRGTAHRAVPWSMITGLWSR